MQTLPVSNAKNIQPLAVIILEVDSPETFFVDALERVLPLRACPLILISCCSISYKFCSTICTCIKCYNPVYTIITDNIVCFCCNTPGATGTCTVKYQVTLSTRRG